MNTKINFNNTYISENIAMLLKNYNPNSRYSWIKFCCDDYTNYGFSFDTEMTMKNVNNLIINNALTTRTEKAKSVQKSRTTKKAEVFTPGWVCEYQVNQCIIGETGFTKEELHDKVINLIFEDGWNMNDYNSYLNKKWLEACCGEAPYVVSRYDAVSGNDITINDRIGFLDRKIQLISRYKKNFTEWCRDVETAYQSTYAYEWQGDNLFIARCNLVLTFVEYAEKYFIVDEKTMRRAVKRIVDIVVKNFTQLDGLTFKRPCSNENGYLYDHQSKTSMSWVDFNAMLSK